MRQYRVQHRKYLGHVMRLDMGMVATYGPWRTVMITPSLQDARQEVDPLNMHLWRIVLGHRKVQAK